MQLILELLKKIFVALQGVYTKAETDSALATKADATALTEEATRVDTRLAEHDAEIETLQRLTEENAKNIEAVSAGTQDATMLTAVANVAKWQTYAAAIQKELDAETAMQFAQEFSRATDEYLADPTKTKDWSRPSIEVNNNPYAEATSSNILVDFSAINASGTSVGNARYASFGDGDWKVVFLPNATSVKNAFSSARQRDMILLVGENTDITFALFGVNGQSSRVVFFGKKTCRNLFMLTPYSLDFSSPSLESLDSLCGGTGLFYSMGSTEAMYATINAPRVTSAKYVAARYSDYIQFKIVGGLPNAIDMTGFCNAQAGWSKKNFTQIEFDGCEARFPKAELAPKAFENRNVFNQAIAFPSLHTGDDMFLNAGMSAANISAVLDSLPSDPVGAGGTGVITFTGCPGAAELTQESESVASATARGWTVEL